MAAEETKLSKKMLPLCLIELLWHHTDARHPLNSRQLLDLLQEKYGVEAERKAVFRNIDWLRDFGFDISTYEENGEGYFLRGRVLESRHIAILIDALLNATHVSAEEQQLIIQRLLTFSSNYFPLRVRHLRGQPPTNRMERPRDLFRMLVLLDYAIENNRMVGFNYNVFGADGQFHNRKDHRYYVSPYEVVCADACYYLVANYDGYNHCTCYRIDRISELRVEEMDARELHTLPGMEAPDAIEQLVYREIFHHGQEHVTAVMRLDEDLVDTLVDAFTLRVDMTRIGNRQVETVISAVPDSILQWMLLHGDRCELVHPPELREQYLQKLQRMMARHGQ